MPSLHFSAVLVVAHAEQNNNNTDLYNQQQGEGILNEWNLWRDNHDLWAEQYTDPGFAQEILQQSESVLNEAQLLQSEFEIAEPATTATIDFETIENKLKRLKKT